MKAILPTRQFWRLLAISAAIIASLYFLAPTFLGHGLFESAPAPTVGVHRIERPVYNPSKDAGFIPSFWARDGNCGWGKSVDITLMPENAKADTYKITVFLKEGDTVLKTFTHPPVSLDGSSVRKTVTVKLPGTEYKPGRIFRYTVTSEQFNFSGGFHCPS